MIQIPTIQDVRKEVYAWHKEPANDLTEEQVHYTERKDVRFERPFSITTSELGLGSSLFLPQPIPVVGFGAWEAWVEGRERYDSSIYATPFNRWYYEKSRVTREDVMIVLPTMGSQLALITGAAGYKSYGYDGAKLDLSKPTYVSADEAIAMIKDKYKPAQWDPQIDVAIRGLERKLQ